MEIKQAMSVRAEPVGEPEAEGVTVRQLVGPESGAKNFHMRRFEIAPGGHTPRHSHAWEHECYILEGQGKVLDADEGLKPVKAGDVIYVPPGQEHQFVNEHWSKLTFLCMIPAPECDSCGG